MNEKRRDPRFKSDQKLWCEGQEVKAEATARDMSRGGMAIVTDKASEIGSRINVSFVTEEQTKVSMNMEVVWHNQKPEGGPVAMGLRIVTFDEGQNAFDRFVEQHLEEPGSGPGEASAEAKKEKPQSSPSADAADADKEPNEQ
jgi:c-di-GMP-binding flagellar brake protein YcgR